MRAPACFTACSNQRGADDRVGHASQLLAMAAKPPAYPRNAVLMAGSLSNELDVADLKASQAGIFTDALPNRLITT